MFTDKVWLLDGGLATELERRGYDLSTPLWSARIIRDDPAAIFDVHRAYLAAGAEIIISATYQISDPTLTTKMGVSLIQHGLDLALEARDECAPTALVAASIGPYGAYLANGAEYTGGYDLDIVGLRDFHAPRFEICSHSAADLLACETLPSFVEAQALLELIRQTKKPAWFSFSCRDGQHINDGTPIRDCALLLRDEPRIAAIGVNCTRPVFVEELIGEIRAVCDKPIVVYPNSNELWDAQRRCWVEGSAEPVAQFVERATRWHAMGAMIIGGCCRTTPKHIQRLSQQLSTYAVC